ncbi:MAG: PorT family protein [Tannerellaceae bacterium]|nr:PorT family protein [Tannerellaceae bacterium]
MKALLIIFLANICLLVAAQREAVKNQPYADLYAYHFGFHIGIHFQNLALFPVIHHGEEEYTTEIPGYIPGLSVGLIADKRLSQWFNLRITPTVHLGSKTFHTKSRSSNRIQQTSVYSGYLQLPVDMKYSSLRINNYRPYLIGGVYGLFDTGGKLKDNIRTGRYDFGLTIGTGCDIYFRRFKLCPELRFCFGLYNVWPDGGKQPPGDIDNTWLKTIEKARARLIVLTFNFE